MTGVQTCALPICDPLNQNIARRGDTGHTKCRINFLPVATVGSPVMAVCDTLPGRINPVEGIVIH